MAITCFWNFKTINIINMNIMKGTDYNEDWMLENLGSENADAVFEELFQKAPKVDDEDGRKQAVQLLCDIISDADSRKKKFPTFLTAFFSLAMAGLAAICIFLWRENHVPAPRWSAEYAPYGQTRSVTLPDESKIWIRNESKLVYPDRFNKGDRTIFADGELYAEISADEDHPFIIDTKGALIKVLGTRFNLSSYEDNGKVSLTLLAGKVEMDIPLSEKNLHFSLVPGDQLKVDRITGEYSQSRVDISSFELWKDARKLYFFDVSLKDIVIELQETFDTTIIVKDNRLLSTRYLASFVNNESLDDILDALNCDGKMKITKKDKTYFIYPNY